jgi:hypothetical protein
MTPAPGFSGAATGNGSSGGGRQASVSGRRTYSTILLVIGRGWCHCLIRLSELTIPLTCQLERHVHRANESEPRFSWSKKACAP